MPTRQLPITVAAVLLVGLATSVAAVNLSRYQVTATSTGGGTREDLDLAKVRELCRDKDGCSVTMRLDIHPDSGPAELLVKTAHLFLAPGNLLWATEEASGKDNDGYIEVVLSVASAAYCQLTDQTGVVDTETGFSVNAFYADGTAECVVTLVD